MPFPTLINTPDTFEVVRDRIAQILKDESANQMVLAVAATLDPAPWDLTVYVERSNPWEHQLNTEAALPLVVNVWYDRSGFDPRRSNTTNRQMASATFNVDIYGYAVAADTAAGHSPGDRQAALEAQRGLRLARRILSSPEHILLGLQGTVWARRLTETAMFAPEQSSHSVQQVVAARIILEVDFNENSVDSDESVLLEEIGVTICRASDGSILATADYT